MWSMKPYLKIFRRSLKAPLFSSNEETSKSRITLRYVAGTNAKTLGVYFNAFISGFDNIIEVAGRTAITSSETFKGWLYKKP